MTKNPQPTDALTAAIQTDLDTIRAALTQARKIAAQHRYSPMGELRYNAQSGLDALGRIEKIVQTRQPQLF